MSPASHSWCLHSLHSHNAFPSHQTGAGTQVLELALRHVVSKKYFNRRRLQGGSSAASTALLLAFARSALFIWLVSGPRTTSSPRMPSIVLAHCHFSAVRDEVSTGSVQSASCQRYPQVAVVRFCGCAMRMRLASEPGAVVKIPVNPWYILPQSRYLVCYRWRSLYLCKLH